MRLGILSFIFVSVCMACGVKGRPQPPAEDSPIGRGRLSYQKATVRLNQPNLDSKTEGEAGAATPILTPTPTPTPIPRRRQ